MKNTDILWFEGGAYKALVMLLILAVLPILLMGCGVPEVKTQCKPRPDCPCKLEFPCEVGMGCPCPVQKLNVENDKRCRDKKSGRFEKCQAE